MYKSGATFSECKKYRFTLFREWNPAKPRLLFILLNPSTATEYINDPTITRCITRAINSGYGSVEIVNVFAWRSTHPKNLYMLPDPIGSLKNDLEITLALRRAEKVICGWGTHGKLLNRGERVMELIRTSRKTPFILGLNADGSPKHPLYIPYKTEPQELRRESLR